MKCYRVGRPTFMVQHNVPLGFQLNGAGIIVHVNLKGALIGAAETVSGVPMFVPASAFSGTVKLAVGLSNAGASSTSTILMVIVSMSESLPSEAVTVTVYVSLTSWFRSTPVLVFNSLVLPSKVNDVASRPPKV